MGVIRFLLALAVVFSHMGPLYGFAMMDGRTAVELFFVISGFYTALILSEKYPASRRGAVLYYGNRILRIFPSYWLVLIFSVCIGILEIKVGGIFKSYGAVSAWFDQIRSIPLSASIYLAFSNIFLLGLDFSYFLNIQPSGLEFTSHSLTFTSGRMDAFSPVPQAWALGLECLVYAIAPVLFRARTWVILAVMAASLLARFVGLQMGANFDPWTYRFFPFELFFFLLGLLSYRFFKTCEIERFKKFALPAFLVISGSLVGFIWSPSIFSGALGFSPRAIQCFVILAVLMPFVFAGTKGSKADKMLGDLSFPMYLVHVTFIPIFGSENDIQRTMILCATLAVSAAILWLVEIPLDRIRQSRVKKLN